MIQWLAIVVTSRYFNRSHPFFGRNKPDKPNNIQLAIASASRGGPFQPVEQVATMSTISKERAPASLSSPVDDVVSKFEWFRVRPRWLFVRIESNNGYVGWGEATLEG